MKENRSKKQNILYLLILTGYICLHAFLVAHHEAWRDEAQAWILAKNSTLPQLFADLCSEGHPALWFLFMRPFAKLGLPYQILGVLTLAVSAAALALLLFRAPVPAWAKICIACSSVFCYYNPVISRIYALTLLVVMLLAACWQKRYDKPVLYGILIALAFQTHIIMAGFAGGLLLCMAFRWCRKETRNGRQLAGTLIAALGMICTFLELYQRSGSTVYETVTVSTLLGNFMSKSPLSGIWQITSMLWPLPGNAAKMLVLLFTVVMTAAAAVLIVKNKEFRTLGDALVVSLCGIVYIIALKIWVYSGTYHMTLCLLMVMVFALWVTSCDSRQKSVKTVLSVLTAVLCLLTAPSWLSAAKEDWEREYSGSLDMAEYIRENLPENSAVLVGYDHKVTAPYAYVDSFRKDIRFYDANTKQEYSYYIWGQSYPGQSAEDLKDTAERLTISNNVYYLSSSEQSASFAETAEKLYETTENSVCGERYFLYRLK